MGGVIVIWPLKNWKKSRDENREKEYLRDLKVLESQHALLNAATETADAANVVTHTLKQRLDDAIQQFQNATRILNDALLVCDGEGVISAANPLPNRLPSHEASLSMIATPVSAMRPATMVRRLGTSRSTMKASAAVMKGTVA